jgi:thioredoxin-related protein
MKKFFGFIFFVVMLVPAFSQDMKKFNLYKPAEDASEMIAQAVKKAGNEGKHVFIQIGGNWCVWCARFNDFTNSDKTIDSLIKADYIVYHLNYSEENKNKEILAKYKFPQRFGFPVFLVLDGKGNLLHTQNSGYLEEGKGYSRSAIIGFFKDWRPSALNSNQYKDE